MSWRDKVHALREGANSQKCPNPSVPKLTEPGFGSFGTPSPAPFQEKTGFSGQPFNPAGVLKNLKKLEIAAAANDPVPVVGLVNSAAVNAPVTSQTPVSSGEVSTLVSSAAAVIDDPDRWCWPHSSAMTGREIDTMAERTALFNRRGLAALDAERLADKLVNRDRDFDDRRLCLECVHLSRVGNLRCTQWQRAGLGAPSIPSGMAMQLQRCDGFKDQNPPRATP